MTSLIVVWLLKKKDKVAFLKKGVGVYKKYIFWVILIFLGLLISTLVNQNYTAGAGIIKGWFLFPIIFSAIAITEVKKEKIFLSYFISSFVVASLALGYFFLNLITFDGRLEAFFNSPNYLAMYLAPALIIGVGLYTRNKKIYGVALAIILVAFYLTFSYAAWASVFIAIIIFLRLNKKIKLKAIGIVLGVAILLFIFSQAGKNKYNDFSHFTERSSLSSRTMVWKAAEKIISDNWFLGIGPGNFQTKYLEYQKYFPPYLEWAVPHPHNIFLSFWLQSGLAGLIGFLGLIYLRIKETSENVFNKNALATLSTAILIYILIHGMVDTTYFKNDLAIVFWLFFFMGIKKF